MRKIENFKEPNNPKRFNAAVVRVIEGIGGDERTGQHCPCPVCGHNSLSVGNGNKTLVVVHCFKCGKEGGPAVVRKLQQLAIWPTSSKLVARLASGAAEQKRTEKERLKFALDCWNQLNRSKPRRFTALLGDYLRRRGIKRVPSTAVVALPIEYQGVEYQVGEIGSHDPAMVLPIRNAEGKFKGVQATWLNADMTDKRDAEPPRQSYGLVKHNFIQLTEMDWEKPLDTLLIAEGAETGLAAMQLTKLTAIATGGKGFMQDLNPPPANTYVILVDNDLPASVGWPVRFQALSGWRADPTPADPTTPTSAVGYQQVGDETMSNTERGRCGRVRITNISSGSKPHATRPYHRAAAGTSIGARSFAASAVTAMMIVGSRADVHDRQLMAAAQVAVRGASLQTHEYAGNVNRSKKLC